MDELAAHPAWDGLDPPFDAGGVTLAAAPEAALFSIAPFRGKAAAVAEALPGPGRTAAAPAGFRLIWAGLDQWLLRGAPATQDLAARLDGLAAVTDQSDGWTALSLTGAGAAEALARLVPIDLDPAAFPEGSTARTQLGHMACLLIAEAEGFEILVMRSFTSSAVHDISTAMRAVAARSEL